MSRESEEQRITAAMRHRPPAPRGNHCPRCFSWAPGTTCQCGHPRRPDGKQAKPCPGPDACRCAAQFAALGLSATDAVCAAERALLTHRAATGRLISALTYSTDALGHERAREDFDATYEALRFALDVSYEAAIAERGAR